MDWAIGAGVALLDARRRPNEVADQFKLNRTAESLKQTMTGQLVMDAPLLLQAALLQIELTA